MTIFLLRRKFLALDQARSFQHWEPARGLEVFSPAAPSVAVFLAHDRTDGWYQDLWVPIDDPAAVRDSRCIDIRQTVPCRRPSNGDATTGRGTIFIFIAHCWPFLPQSACRFGPAPTRGATIFLLLRKKFLVFPQAHPGVTIFLLRRKFLAFDQARSFQHWEPARGLEVFFVVSGQHLPGGRPSFCFFARNFWSSPRPTPGVTIFLLRRKFLALDQARSFQHWELEVFCPRSISRGVPGTRSN